MSNTATILAHNSNCEEVSSPPTAALPRLPRSEKIADHAPAHLEGDVLLLDVAGTLEVADAVAIHDDAAQRQVAARNLGARAAEQGQTERDQQGSHGAQS